MDANACKVIVSQASSDLPAEQQKALTQQIIEAYHQAKIANSSDFVAAEAV